MTNLIEVYDQYNRIVNRVRINQIMEMAGQQNACGSRMGHNRPNLVITMASVVCLAAMGNRIGLETVAGG